MEDETKIYIYIQMKKTILLSCLLSALVVQMGFIGPTDQNEPRIVILTSHERDGSMEQALTTLSENVPSSQTITTGDLSDMTKIRQQDVVVIVGHGTPHGLKNKGEIIPWSELYEKIQAEQPTTTLVLACYSPTRVSKRIYGFHNQIDAQAGALLVAKAVTTTLGADQHTPTIYGRIFYQRVWQLQEEMKHPLATYICFVHGYYGGNDDFWNLEDYLSLECDKIGSNKDYQDIYYFDYFANYVENGWQGDENAQFQCHNTYFITDYADDLWEYINTIIPAGSQIDIVAHSMGGLIAREMIRKYGGFLLDNYQMIGRVVSIATPHLGTNFADHVDDEFMDPLYDFMDPFWDTQVMASMDDQAAFIAQLNADWDDYKDETRWYALSAWDHGIAACRAAIAYFWGCANDCIVPTHSAVGQFLGGGSLGFTTETHINFDTGLSGDAHSKIIKENNTDWDVINSHLQGALDTDGDNLYDYVEYSLYQTDPYSIDTDGDTYTDFDEVELFNTDPNDANDYPSDFADTSNYAYPLSFDTTYTEAIQVNDVDWVYFSSSTYDKLTLKIREVKLMTITVTLYSAEGGLTQSYQQMLSPNQTLTKQWDRAQGWGEDFYVKIEYVSGGSVTQSGSYQLEVELYIS